MKKLILVCSCLFVAIPCQAKTIFVDAYGLVWQGPVWSVAIFSDKAWDPNPPDGQEFVIITPILSWKAGIDALWHVIYFGTSFDDVNDSIVQPLVPPPLSYRGYKPVGFEYWDPITDGGLTIELDTTYYWRIDEGLEELAPPIGGGTVIKGDVWSFTTAPPPIFVNMDAAGANNGTSWENAYNYLQDALADANSLEEPVEICVAQGVYKPDQGVGQTPGDRTATFKLINSVVIKGGYAGFGQPEPNARDIKLYETILDGDLNGNDREVDDPCDLFSDPCRAENSYHVVTGSSTDATAVLDGFIITGGNAYKGAGINPGNSRPLIINCTFEGNSATDSGGAAAICDLEPAPTFINCKFNRNAAGKNGGGLWSEESNPILTDCTFTENWAGGEGGGIYGGAETMTNCSFLSNSAQVGGGVWLDTRATLTNCIFTDNLADYGGGMYSERYSLILSNCVFSGNTAKNDGGGMHNSETSTFSNCMFIGNYAGGNGGGIYNGFYPTPTFSNCTFSGNYAGGAGGGLYNDEDTGAILTNCILWADTPTEIDMWLGGTAVITYSDIQGGWPGLGNIDADPCFVDVNNGDYHLKSQAGRWDPNSESWVLDDVTSPCIDAGNPGCPVGNEPAPNGNRINIGAYGGTAEASKSPANWRSIADMTNDWVVDSNDLKVFVSYWLQTGECIPSDFDRSQFVDFSDFAILGQQWSYPSASEPGMTFHIDDCNMEDGLGWSVDAEPNQPRFSVWVEGSYIHFEDLMYANCCPDELGLDKEINGNEITLYEIGYGGLCDCMCYFPITATLGPFEDGTYTVEVYDNLGNWLGVVEVTIGQTSGPTIIYEIEDCNQNASGVFVAEPPDLTRFTVTVEGLYIHFEDMMVANCCPDELGLEMTIEDDLITIYETEYTPGGCYCICDYPIKATLGPFEPGIYTLEVYEEWSGFIGSTTVVIEPPE